MMQVFLEFVIKYKYLSSQIYLEFKFRKVKIKLFQGNQPE